MIRILVLLATLFSLFFFPYVVSVVLILVSALTLPFSGIAFGILADALYYSQGSGIPWWTIVGAGATLLALLVHRFVKTRIIE
ncbi:hypothetical protein KJ819_01775 [Patescibacteria group bacterium]|nr:hypothetical protein [Patescibacteria group bacterium]MBU1500987.1 hypothetical protein [Patescibacteria group bacterium]MBU2080617.1 hypothetical protein [Patescibacteria group bacterium]MBU2124308.1 hypothetical protein [Patescibacteria group bacterium]MBU2194434.1 hypothetical protein [Patescibacteria group bacterium]